MPTASKRPAAKAAPKPAPKPAAKPAAAPASKANQAAAHQNRPAPAAQPARQASVPATVKQAPLPAELNTNLPSFMQQDAGVGLDKIGQGDLEIPRLKLMQSTSKELTEYNDLKPGHFWHTAAEFIFDGPFRAVPIFVDKRYLLWRPLEQGGGILARSDDGINWSPGEGEFNVKLDKAQGGAEVVWKLAPTVAESGLAMWGSQNPADPDSPPAATLMYNFLLAFPDHPDLMPAVLSFQRTGVKAGRRLLTKLKTNRAPIFGTIWEFGAQEEGPTTRRFQTISVQGAGLVDDEDQYNMYRQMHEQFGNTGLNIKDIETLQTEGDGDNAADDGSGPAM